MNEHRGRGVFGISRRLAIASIVLLAGCATTPSSVPSPVGVTSATILDADPSSTRYALYRRSSDGAWFFGGGAEAFAERADIPMKMEATDRTRIGGLMEEAGWLDPDHDPTHGDGPRRLEVSLAIGGQRRNFTVMADGRVLPPPVEALMRTLKSVADRRFAGVIDALPKGRGGD